MSRNVWTVVAAVGAAVLTAVGEELAAGRVPLPSDYRWLAPIAVALLVVVTHQLKVFAGEEPES